MMSQLTMSQFVCHTPSVCLSEVTY